MVLSVEPSVDCTFFKFNRLWSIRNLDLLLLILLAPGLLAVEYGGYKASSSGAAIGIYLDFLHLRSLHRANAF